MAVLKAYQSFTEEKPDPKDKAPDEEPVLLDLEEGVFANNLGLPLVIVATKVRSRKFYFGPSIT